MAEKKQRNPQTKSPNEGEGNRTAAREYNKEQRDFVKSGQVDESAEKARRAVESEEKKALEEAEAEGRSKAREFDPNVTRSPKPSRS